MSFAQPPNGELSVTQEQPKRSEAAQRFVDKSNFELARARELGLERLPSVDGPYLVDARTGDLVAAAGSPEYRKALYGDKGQLRPEPGNEPNPEPKPKAPRMRP